MSDLKKELRDIHLKIMKAKHYMADFYWKKAKEKYCSNDTDEKFDYDTNELMAWIFSVFVDKVREKVGELWEGKINPSSEYLTKLEANLKEILESIDGLEKYPKIIEARGSDFISNTKQGIKKAQKDLIPFARWFANIGDQFDNLDKTNFSWQKVKQLWEQNQAIQAPNSFTTETVKMLKAGMTVKIAEISVGLKKATETGELPVKFLPEKQDLDFIEKIASETLNIMDWIEREKASEIKNREEGEKFRKEVQELKSWIQEQRKKSSLSESQKEKISAQQVEIEQLKNQLAELQKQIDDLKKQNSESSQSGTKDNSANQKLTQLENQKKEIEKKIEAQQEQIKKQIQNPSKFQWWYVALPVGIILLIVGGIIFYVKKVKKQNS